MRHLFVITPGVSRSISVDEVEATALALKEAGLYAMPYDRDVYIEIDGTEGVGPDVLPGLKCVYGPYGRDQVVKLSFQHPNSKKTVDDPDPFDLESARELEALLIVLLATKNAEKQTTENKLAKLGIGKGPRGKFAYTTTISLPRDLDDDGDNPPKGVGKAPHLRRGHIRRQPFGPGREQIKVIFIAPIFVNADPDFVATRRKYVLGKLR